jgi:alkane 1-monooxygenase
VWLVATQSLSVPAMLALALAIGGVAGIQGITFAHEMGHMRSHVWRLGAWLLTGSVTYAHFMVEHYRGHHVRAATPADPATARRGESLWRFLPRVLQGSWRSPLVWACAFLQVALLATLTLAGGWMLLAFWLVPSANAVFLLETTNYIEHYGLVRAPDAARANGHAAFGSADAWGADQDLTNCIIANLQRHADHHMHPGRPYAELRPVPGPSLPTGYDGCLFLGPRLWFSLTEPRLRSLEAAASATMPAMPGHRSDAMH